MKVAERCGKCGGSVEADDQPTVYEKGGNSLADREGVYSGGAIYADNSGVGYARVFVEKWRTEHRCEAALGVGDE